MLPSANLNGKNEIQIHGVAFILAYLSGQRLGFSKHRLSGLGNNSNVRRQE